MRGTLQAAVLVTLLPAAAGATAPAGSSPVRVVEALCDGRRDPVGVDPAGVRFSWVMQSESRGQAQGAYRLEVASSRGALLAGRSRRSFEPTGSVISAAGGGDHDDHDQTLHRPLRTHARAKSRKWSDRAYDSGRQRQRP